jgi:predicted GH43/DUF377 family glycosyl hydrolase
MSIEKIKARLKKYLETPFNGTLITVIKITEKQGKVILYYKSADNPSIKTAISNDGFCFTESTQPYTLATKPSILPNLSDILFDPNSKKGFAYFGNRSINIAFQKKGVLEAWQNPLIVASNPLQCHAVFERKNNLLLLYYKTVIEKGITYYSAHLALFCRQNPEKLIWKTTKPLWYHKEIWPNKSAKPLGAVMLSGKIITYWLVENKFIFSIILSGFMYDPTKIKKTELILKKHIDNPIISPNPKNNWEAFNTLNPAAVYANNKVHILYRAQGFDYISSVGYAVSSDGVSIEKRFNKPIYQPIAGFETNETGKVNPNLMSAGGHGGVEDPRATLLENKIYMTYVAFNGWDSVRLALTYIYLDDFLKQRWNWSKPVLISRPGVIDKSGCLLPEKVNGKYVFFHRIFPNILIDYVDNLSFTGKNKYLKGQYQIKVRENMWDSRKIGAGAPPIKTESGWLLIYYGVDDRDDSKYHIGAMLLDLNQPEKVLYRTNHPILMPTKDYENTGFKPGIAYPCGAVKVKDQLLVYYGAADSVVCVATANIETFLNELKGNQTIHMHSIKIKEVSYQP